jgi:hypothetical protein
MSTTPDCAPPGPPDEADRWLREIVAGRARPAVFMEPSALQRGREPVRLAAGSGGEPSVKVRAARAEGARHARRRRLRSLAGALVVIACLSALLGRLSWLVIHPQGARLTTTVTSVRAMPGNRR